ncbi:MAG: hypothetical protein ACKO9Q_13465, partial [Pirellula sp.]
MKPTPFSSSPICCLPFLTNDPKTKWPATLLLLAYLLFAWLPENRLTAQNPTSQDSFDPETIHYRIEFKEPAIHRVQIEVSFATHGAKEIRLMMPVWTPGSYMVREYARQIESLEAYDKNGPIKTIKADKNHWVV